ncbi:hypothetical protein WMY93_016760 [Mugilogobius chulae]|uniref:Zinc finger FYVE domain-containing protein 26 n=1 Tax=Mugilogobius chulae TaxID=88201 RepID=A0AAW0NME9_9GOBI
MSFACVPQLVNSTGGLSENLWDIIKSIVCHPYDLKWQSLGSPHKLAWYWLQILEKWSEEQVSATVKRELEFLLLLDQLGSEGIATGLVKSCTEESTLQQPFIQHLIKKLDMPEMNPEKKEEWVKDIYAVLSVMPGGSSANNGQFEVLCEALWAATGSLLKEERVLSSLVRPQCDTLVSVYSSTAVRLQRDHLLRTGPNVLADLPEAQKLTLSLCSHKERPSIWKTIYFECLSSGKHFLEQVLVTALDLIKHEEFAQLKDLLHLEFRPLSRLILLLGWTQCRSLSCGQTLLNILHNEQEAANDTALQEFAHILSSQLQILEWCKNNNPEISTEALLAQLHTLDSHSALYILHSLTPLAQFEEHKILSLLKQLPKHHQATDEIETIHNLMDSGAHKNIILFQSFCAMKYAIYALCINAHSYSNCTECGSKQQSKTSEAEICQTSTSSKGCQVVFQHYLSECQRHLEVVPAVFRLELMENIFSLLFLSSTDFSLPVIKDNTTSLESNAQTSNSTKDQTKEVAEGYRDFESLTPSCSTVGHHLDLAHFVQGCRGFLVDASAMEGLLKLLKEGLESLSALAEQDGFLVDAELAESIGCSVTPDAFMTRLKRLSKRTFEAQWRLQIINQNHNSVDGMESPLQTSTFSFPTSSVARSKSSSLRRRRRHGRHTVERENSVEKHNGEVSTSASDSNGGSTSTPEFEVCPCGGPHSWLVPAMLASPESLLMSCIRRGNFMEAHHVSQMFNLEASACCGELVFMEHYKKVLVELGQVEQKMESQSMSSSSSSEGLGSTVIPAGNGRTRLGSSGRTTLQAIGSAAAAGVAFYSVADIADRLLSTAAHPMPCLEEDYWIRQCPSDNYGLLYTLLEELSPAAMAAFDLACCHCQLWKTSRQLLDTAERRLSTSHSDRGVRVDPKLPHSEGICGFPMVLQQINKILNHSSSNKSSTKPDSPVEEVLSSPFGCCVQEVMLCCYPTLSEESISSRLTLAQKLETTLQILSTATKSAEGTVGGPLLDLLVEQSRLKQAELDSHPVRSNMKQLLRSLDQLCPFEPDGELSKPDYVRSFLDYINILASVLVRSLGSDDNSGGAKLGNPLFVLLQAPSQLLSYLLFDRQVSPDRVLSLLQQEGLQLSVQEVIVQRCCETLPVWISSSGSDSALVQDLSRNSIFGAATLSLLLQEHMQEQMFALGLRRDCKSESGSESDNSIEDQSTTQSSISSSTLSLTSSQPPPTYFLMTPSALSFLKSRSPLLATLACLSASKGEPAKIQKSFFRSGRKEAVLDGEQISKEVDGLLKEFPILRSYIYSMVEPLMDVPLGDAEEVGLGAVLCGKPLVSLLFSGAHEDMTQSVAAETFKEALISKDLKRALNLLELYGQGCNQEVALRDKLLACAALEDGDSGTGHLFRVQDAHLRARVTLKSLERWPLSSCLELLEFCLNDPFTDSSLRAELELRKKELDIYHWMLDLQPPLPWATWQELRVESRTNSEYLMSMMLEAKEFALCAQWVELYPVSDQLRLKLKAEHLLHLLEKGQTDEAFQLLESLSDYSVGLEVCEQALDKRPGLSACHFLADYLTLHFERQVSPARRRHIHALHLGSKVLLTLPSAARHEYFPLLSEPLLMLEQLLMNLKVDWAGLAVATLRGLLVGQEAGFNTAEIDTILEEYASKALDFSCAPSQRSRSDSVISLQEGLLQCPAQESSSSSSSRIDSPTSSTNSTPTHTSNNTEKDKDKVSGGKKRLSLKFQPPEQPPAQKDWVPDTQHSVCMVCRRERFTMFNRRHHCRRCGRLVCQACSEKKMAVQGCPGEEVRVCDQCYAFFHPESDDEEESDEGPSSPGAPEDLVDGTLHLPEVTHRKTQLSTDPAENQLLRNEFYFEQAPSAPLCVAILSLHSDQKSCGHQLITHCRSLSRKLTNPEVDACLLTDIMKKLLFSAKLMFVKVGRSQDLALCDSYISKVDVLKILVMANYKYIPSLDEILETSSVTRLRNQLLEDEHYQLAVEVSTKSGLDPSGVWQAWGLACLKGGNLSGAREKFARCLKPPVDRNQLTQGPPLLQEIVQHLETSVRLATTTSYVEDILASLYELEEALSESGPIERLDGQRRNSSYHQECLFYLNTYGTHLALISFYMRHDCLLEAIKHLLNKECPDDVFLEGVLQPSLSGPPRISGGSFGEVGPRFRNMQPLPHRLLSNNATQRTLSHLVPTTTIHDGSRASCHDLYSFLHTWSQFIPSTRRTTELVGQSQRSSENISPGAAGQRRGPEKDFQLEAQSVYTRAGQLLIRQRKYGAVKQLLKCVSESGTATKTTAKELESLILEIKSTESKIKAYLSCSKLRPAYLLAVKLESSRAGPLVQDVRQAAEEANDSVMRNICQQWLSEHLKSSPKQRQDRPNAR